MNPVLYVLQQLWPNLAANVIWVPLAWLHHRMINRKLKEVKDNVAILASSEHPTTASGTRG
jgi:hypothetical protein